MLSRHKVINHTALKVSRAKSGALEVLSKVQLIFNKQRFITDFTLRQEGGSKNC